MESFSVSTNLNEQDWKAYNRAVVARVYSSVSIWWRIALIAFVAITVFVFLTIGLPISGPSFLIGAAAAFAFVFISYRINNGPVQKKQRDVFLGTKSYEFSAAGLHSSRNGVQSSVEWSEISEVAIAADLLLVWLKHPSAFVVPVRDLPTGISRDEIVAGLRAWMANETSAEPPAIADPDALPLNEWIEQRHSGSALKLAAKQSLVATLFRLLLLRDAQGAGVTGSDRSIVALASLPILLWVVIGRVEVGGNAELYLYNLPALAFIAVALLLLVLILARNSNPSIEFRRVLVIVLAVLPIVIVAAVLIAAFISHPLELLALFALFAYVTAYVTRALRALSGTSQAGVAIAGMVLGAALWFAASSYLYLDTTLWYDPKVAEESADEWKSTRDQSESLLFNQRERIDAKVDALTRPDGVASANFFVGFAGVGEQKVFAEEIKLASTTVGERYGIDNRSLLLINDQRDVDSNPLATGTNLHYALSRLAKKMNVDEDVLFLSLSSHGSDDPELSVSNAALPLNDLTGEALAQALDESGIKWRVIIISACHSGAFIPFLENPNTVILTASAADKTSFGCSDERDLTYFGEAFYRDALPNSKSLLDAFNVARASITERETKEGMKTSDPQISVGAEIAEKLNEPPEVAEK